MTLIRNHRGQLDDSMRTVRQICNRGELIEIIRDELRPFGVSVTPEMVHVEPYGYDQRIQWDTYIVTIDGYGVWGMSNGPLTEARGSQSEPAGG